MPNNRISPDAIIKDHVIWSMGLGLIPIPGIDFFAVSYIQQDMLKKLAKSYFVDYSNSSGKAVISSIISTGTARLLATSLIKIIPGAGTIVGMSAAALTSGASTYALGEVFKDHFKNGGTFHDVNIEILKKSYQEAFKKGKVQAKQWHEEHQNEQAGDSYEKKVQKEQAEVQQKKIAEESMDQKIARLSKLAEMRNSGLLSEEEFTKLKQKLFD